MSSTSSTSPAVNLTGLVSNTNWQSLASEINANQLTAAEAPVNNDLTAQQNLLSAWQSFNTTLSALTSYISTNNLNAASGYQAFTGSLTCADSSITASNVLSAATGTGTIAAGTYSIEVTTLAAAEKIASDPQTSSDTALGFSGDMVINGTTVSVASTDTLSDVVANINSRGRGGERLAPQRIGYGVLFDPPVDRRRFLRHNPGGRHGLYRAGIAGPRFRRWAEEPDPKRAGRRLFD